MGNYCSKIINEENNTEKVNEIEIIGEDIREDKSQNLDKEPSSPLFKKVTEDFDQNISKLGNRSITSSSSNINSNDNNSPEINTLQSISEEVENELFSNVNNINKEIGEEMTQTFEYYKEKLENLNQSLANNGTLKKEEQQEYISFLEFVKEGAENLKKKVEGSKNLTWGINVLLLDDYTEVQNGKEQIVKKMFLQGVTDIAQNKARFPERSQSANAILGIHKLKEISKPINNKYPNLYKEVLNNVVSQRSQSVSPRNY